MKNFSSPLSEFHTLKPLFLKNPFTRRAQNFLLHSEYYLQAAEFIDNDSLIGLFEHETEPVNFFIENNEKL